MTVGESATAPSDYLAESGRVTIPAGDWYSEFSITVNGDRDVEPDERVGFRVSDVSGATYALWAATRSVGFGTMTCRRSRSVT